MGKNYFKIIIGIFILFTFSCGFISKTTTNKNNEQNTSERAELGEEYYSLYTCNEQRFVIKDSITDVRGYVKLLKCLIAYGSEDEIAEIVKKCDYSLIYYLAGSEFFLENLRGEIVFQSFLAKGTSIDCAIDFDGNCTGSSLTVFNTKMLKSMIESIEDKSPKDFIFQEFRALEYNKKLEVVVSGYDFPTKDVFGFSVIKKAWEEDKIVLKPNDIK